MRSNLKKTPLLAIYLVSLNLIIIPYVNVDVGPISLNYAKDLILVAVLCVAVFLHLAANSFKIFASRFILLSFTSLLAFCIIYGFTLTYSLSPATGLRYYPKYVFVFLVYAYFLSSSPDPKQVVRYLIYGLLAYYLIAIIGHYTFFADETYLEGPSGRHYTKFISLFGLLAGISYYLTFRTKTLGVILIFLSSVCLFLVMQRGALIAAFVGVAAIVFHVTKHKLKQHLFKIVATTIAAVLALTFLLSNESFREYAFYESTDPSAIVASIKDGTFDPTMIRDRGRMKFIEYLMSSEAWRFYGLGIGSVPFILQPFGDTHYELHNDLILLLYEGGVFLLPFFLAFMYYSWRAGNVALASSDKIQVFIGYTIIGWIPALLVYMAISNVLTYSTFTLGFLAILLATLSHLTRQASTVRNAFSEPVETE